MPFFNHKIGKVKVKQHQMLVRSGGNRYSEFLPVRAIWFRHSGQHLLCRDQLELKGNLKHLKLYSEAGVLLLITSLK